MLSFQIFKWKRSSRSAAEARKLALKSLDCAHAPTLRHGLGHGIGENVLFAFLQSFQMLAQPIPAGLLVCLGLVSYPYPWAREDPMDCHPARPKGYAATATG